MPRQVVPIANIARRLPEAGRIRLGVKSGNAMKSIDTFRFTSQDRDAISQVADLYGGTVEPWSDAKAVGNQWQVITEAHEIRIALPPDPLGGTPVYEMWGGGGCERRCDGETCDRYVTAADGIDIESGPCICMVKGVLECKAITRLSILLPEVRFIGVWRLDTKSMNAAQELPGMVEMIQGLQARGIVRAVLRVERREQRMAGKTHKFVVPALGLDASVDQLAAGSLRLGQIAEPERVAIGTSTEHLLGDVPPRVDPDDEVIDAEIVDGITSADMLERIVGRVVAKEVPGEVDEHAKAIWRKAKPKAPGGLIPDAEVERVLAEADVYLDDLAAFA